MIRHVLVLMIAFAWSYAYAQNGYGSQSIYDETAELPKGVHIFTLPSDEYWYKQNWIDSIYAVPKFEEGRLELETGVTPTNRPLINYNIFLNVMLIKDNNDEFLEVKDKGIKAVWIGGHQYIYGGAHGYMEVIVNGKVSVAERTRLVGVYELTNGFKYRMRTGDVRNGLSKYTRHYWKVKDYFIFSDGGHVQPATSAALLKMFSKDRDAIKAFAKENKTDFEKKGDLLKIVSFCNDELQK